MKLDDLANTEVKRECDKNYITYCSDYNTLNCNKNCSYAKTVIATKLILNNLTKK